MSTSNPAQRPGQSPKRILVVDDEPVVREALEAVLALRGHHVVLAANGQAALCALAAAPFDLVFLDLLMPDIGGADVLRAVKECDPQPAVVLITGFPHHEEALAARDLGPVRILPKPITLSEIDALLDSVLPS